MSAVLVVQPLVLAPMTVADLHQVMAIETQAYAFPWTRGNLVDSLAAGYLAQMLQDAGGEVLGYYVAMPGVDELHLLNLTVAPAWQGRGHGWRLLAAVEAAALQHGLGTLWLEVRAGNERAQQMYRKRGFVASGIRRGYYPAPGLLREDAVVMCLPAQALARGDDQGSGLGAG
ncbi:MAG TPA: ribosomal protein S18-alanine N-acetyltransferase [Rubrivivax sp.]